MLNVKEIAGALAVSLACTGAGAATLIGSATLNGPGDLTVIDDNGTIFEFLDLSATDGLSVTAALAANPGFALATETEVTALFGAFGIAYAFTPGPGTFDTTDISGSVTDAEATLFMNTLGLTLVDASGQASVGFYADRAGNQPLSRFCISIGRCAFGSFTQEYGGAVPNASTGVTLVREAVAIPLPASAALLLTGLGLGALVGRRLG